MRYKLIAGGIMLAALAAVAAFPTAFAKFPEGYQDTLRSVEGPQGTEWRFAPESPSSTYLFGTDAYGYDIHTRILFGLRWTLGCVFTVALSRTLLGGAIGVARAFVLRRRNAGASVAPRGTVSPLAVVPSFVFVFFIIYPVTINSPLGGASLFAFQCAAMTAFDMGGIISAVSLKTEALLDMPFVEGAVSCGARGAWIARRHVLPFLVEDLLEAFATQTVAVLQLVGRLGVFSLFVGGTVMHLEPVILSSATGEIAGLIGLYRGRLQAAQWMLLYPLGAYLVVLGSLRLFVSGLHDELMKRDKTFY